MSTQLLDICENGSLEGTKDTEGADELAWMSDHLKNYEV